MVEKNPDARRKNEHLDINLQKNVSSGISSGFENIRFVHNALPEIDYGEVDTETIFLGKKLAAPILISGMTGGTERGGIINRRLAEAAQKESIGMCLGSFRILLNEPKKIDGFAVRDAAPDIFLAANLGAVQLGLGFTPPICLEMLESIGADALVLHLNPLQELLQPEGDKNWENITEKIEELTAYLPLPVIVKEVGYGLSEKVAAKLANIGVGALDTAGAGGTSWSLVESYRAKDRAGKLLAESFTDWGISSLDSLIAVRKVSPSIPLVASGGIYSGIDGAKALRLGADLFGSAAPFLMAADESAEKVSETIKLIKNQLKISMFCTGSLNLPALKVAEIKFSGKGI